MSDELSAYWSDKLGIHPEVPHLSAEQEELMHEDPMSDASYSVEQVEHSAKNSLDFLAGLCMPLVFRVCFPPVLITAWQLLTQAAGQLRNNSRIALGIPRGHGKTTLVKIFVLYCILFTNRKFVLIISSTSTLAENILSDIEDMLNERNILKVFGDWKVGIENKRQDLKKFGFRGRNIVLAAIGAGGSIRGLNIKNERPDVMIFEDIQTKEDSESSVISAGLLRWMIGTAMKARSPLGCLTIFCGNMYPGPHSILKQLKSNPTWIKFISGAILADGTALWEGVRNLESLLEELDNDISMGHPEIFFSEVLNDTEAGINTKTDLSLIREWPWSKDDLPQGKFIIIDPSSGKKGGDDVAIGYVEVYDGTPGLREVIEENLSPGNTIRKALLLALRTGTKVIAAEATGYQSTLLYWFGIICADIGLTGFHFVEVHTNAIAKNSRITDALKSLTAGEIDIHGDVRSQVTNQISNWNPLKRDNTDGILDLLGYILKVIELYGPILSTETSLEYMDYESSRVDEDAHVF
jgi:hypothetical protein